MGGTRATRIRVARPSAFKDLNHAGESQRHCIECYTLANWCKAPHNFAQRKGAGFFLWPQNYRGAKCTKGKSGRGRRGAHARPCKNHQLQVGGDKGKYIISHDVLSLGQPPETSVGAEGQTRQPKRTPSIAPPRSI